MKLKTQQIPNVSAISPVLATDGNKVFPLGRASNCIYHLTESH